jgi:serine protease inhibitor
VFSSYSLVLALLMALAGSNKDTKTEMIKTLRVDNYLGTNYSNYNNLDKFFKNLNKNLISYYDSTPSGSMNNKLIIANKVLVNDIEIRNSYHKLIEKTFNTKINMANGSFKKVIDDTNKWIENITNNKIKNLLDDSFQISSLVLINVIYFKYNWLNKFNKRFTQTDQNFYLNPSRTEMSKVDMMNVYRKRLPYSYLQSIDSHLVKLPYENKRYYFNVILPYNEDDFLDKNDKLSIINKINLDELKRGLFEEDYTRFISLKMPKFKIKAKFEVN